MERVTQTIAKSIFGKNFIGSKELHIFLGVMGSQCSLINLPDINIPLNKLMMYSKDYILIYGKSSINGNILNIRHLRDKFGIDPLSFEPCFYNQDWYINETFITKSLEDRWYLIRKNVINSSRGIPFGELKKDNIMFPTAILCAYTFFAYYFVRHSALWKGDYIWCSDCDHNGDQIYVGRYIDAEGMNKNGFSIHRYLSLKSCYCAVDGLKI